jgi:hypothetical protein
MFMARLMETVKRTSVDQRHLAAAGREVIFLPAAPLYMDNS